jgi:hypothetical protein
MPKKQKAEIDPMQAADSTAAPAPAKKPAAPKAKSAAATHKTAANRGTRSATKKTASESPEAQMQEVVELVGQVPISVVEESVEIIETPVAAAVVEAGVPDETALPEYCEPGTPEEREEVARIAYSYYVTRNFAPGDPLVDWLRAEEEYRSRRLARV